MRAIPVWLVVFGGLFIGNSQVYFPLTCLQNSPITWLSVKFCKE